MLSLFVWPKVITLSGGFYCTSTLSFNDKFSVGKVNYKIKTLISSLHLFSWSQSYKRNLALDFLPARYFNLDPTTAACYALNSSNAMSKKTYLVYFKMKFIFIGLPPDNYFISPVYIIIQIKVDATGMR